MNSLFSTNNAWITGHSGFIGNSLIEDLRELICDGDLLLLKGSSSSNVHKIAKKLLSHFPVRKIA